MGYQCQFHDGPGEATTLLTSLRDGQTLASCDADVPVMLTGALAAFLNVDTAKLWSNIERFAKRNAAPAPADQAQAPDPGPDQVSITCPFCETEMVVLPTDADLAKEQHLASCEKFRQAQESEQT